MRWLLIPALLLLCAGCFAPGMYADREYRAPAPPSKATIGVQPSHAP
jgi:hypothetical protein